MDNLQSALNNLEMGTNNRQDSLLFDKPAARNIHIGTNLAMRDVVAQYVILQEQMNFLIE